MSPFKRRNLIKHLLMVSGLTVALFSVLPIHILIIYLIAVNLWLLVIFGFDKQAAKGDKRRTPETTFHALAVLGAFPALLLGRKIFRHKTIKKSFLIPMWILFTLEVGAIVYFIYFFTA